MADFKTVGSLERGEQVIAAAQQIVKALGTSKNPTEDMIKFLSDFDAQLSKSRMPEFVVNKADRNQVEERLDIVQDKIMSWDSDQSMIWDCSQEEASDYLQAVDDVQKLTENLGGLSLEEDNQVENELLHRAHNILQMAMARLEEEFSHILVKNKQFLEPEQLSFRSFEDDFVYDDSISSFEADSVECTQERLLRDGGHNSEEYIVDLVDPSSVPDLKCIAEAMFFSHYDRECCQAYSSIRKDALDECLFILEVEKMSIEEVLKMDWSDLNQKIKKWNRAIKIFVRVYLSSEKRLCDQIFKDFGSASRICFIETSKGSMMQLMNFAEAIAIGPCSPEKLFRVLDMYEGLADLLPDIDALFMEEAGCCVRSECHEVLKRVGNSISCIFVEFENAVRKNTSSNPYAGGGIHPLTKYVMNYIRALMDYSEILNLILEDSCEEEQMLPLSNSNQIIEEDEEWRSFRSVTLMARRLGSITSTLESNLDCKSKLYKDSSLQHFFLMNNIYYMVQKVRSSELGTLLGDDWIRKHNRTFQQQALSYERASWNFVLSFLKDEGICSPVSSSVSRTVLKERFKSFNLAFEEIYKTQTAWLIADLQLRDDLRISVSLKVVQAYRTFLGRYAGQLEGSRNSDKYIKYSAEDLENYLLDFFEGSLRSLNNQRRR
ncbi:exocyst complex component EXO70E2-like [Aristolochia californica]|uniref:exocyst complex component EXO70E2-like n=1 Tax=Aristolochia californica TaxID=171875 RepID=UPI0035E123A2